MVSYCCRLIASAQGDPFNLNELSSYFDLIRLGSMDLLMIAESINY
jgi:hypothetical protein